MNFSENLKIVRLKLSELTRFLSPNISLPLSPKGAVHDAWDVIHRMNEGKRTWGVLKSMLSNRGLEIKAKKCLYEGVIEPTALYGTEAWGMRSAEIGK